MTDIKEVMEAGLALLEKGKNLDALRELSKLEPEFEGKATDEAADLYTAISQAYYGMNPKTDENSLLYADRAFEIHKKNKNKDSMMNDLLYSAFIEMDCNKSAEAEKRLDSAIKIAQELKDNDAYAELLTTKADLLSGKKKRRKEAESIYLQAADLAKKNG
ncbi:TPR repeat-containing protein, partial [mine drainage metagenome]